MNVKRKKKNSQESVKKIFFLKKKLIKWKTMLQTPNS